MHAAIRASTGRFDYDEEDDQLPRGGSSSSGRLERRGSRAYVRKYEVHESNRSSSNSIDIDQPIAGIANSRFSSRFCHTFRNCDYNQDGLLSRSEFSAALQMTVHAFGERQWYDDLSVEDIDAEFGKAYTGAEEDQITHEAFEAWLPTFRDGYLQDRQVLRSLDLSLDSTHATITAAGASEADTALRAIAARCRSLTSLSIRGATDSRALEYFAAKCGSSVLRLDLSLSSACAADLKALAESGACTALRVLRVVGCEGLDASSMAVITRNAFPRLCRLVVSDELPTLSHSIEECEVVKVPLMEANSKADTEDQDILLPASRADAEEAPSVEAVAPTEVELHVEVDTQSGKAAVRPGSCCAIQ